MGELETMRSIGIAGLGALAFAAVVAGSTGEDQRKQYEADIPKTILDSEQFRQSNSAPIKSGSGREGVATLVNLNPTIETWYLLRSHGRTAWPSLRRIWKTRSRAKRIDHRAVPGRHRRSGGE